MNRAIDKTIVISSNDNVINIHKKKNSELWLPINEQRSIRLGVHKPLLAEKLFQFLISGIWSLFEVVNSFLKLAHMRWKLRIDKPWWLCHKYILGKNAMKKYIIHIKLSKWPIRGQGKTKNEPDSSRFHNRTECLNIVNTGMLMKALGHKTSFLLRNRTIKIVFDPENPFTTN